MSALAKPNVIALDRTKPAPTAALCPWEDAATFGDLRQAFMTSHRPDGPTEAALLDRLTMIEWRRRRLVAAEAAVHVAHAFDRADEDTAKRKTLIRAGLTDYKMRDQISVREILRGSDQEDSEAIAVIREGITDVETALQMIAEGSAYKAVLAALDSDMQDWWDGELAETEDGKPKFGADISSLKRFLADDALPWRKNWLKTNEIRPAIRAQAIAESFDPIRLRQLWDLEASLDRQFEKALAMLIRLQELRLTARPSA